MDNRGSTMIFNKLSRGLLKEHSQKMKQIRAAVPKDGVEKSSRQQRRRRRDRVIA